MIQTKKKTGTITWEEFRRRNFPKQKVEYTDDPSEFLELLELMKGRKHGTRKK